MELWFDILPALAEKYGWGPNEVADLTLDQLAIYLAGGNPDKPQMEWVDPEVIKAQIRAQMEMS